MKTRNQEINESIFSEFVLTSEEMICIKGGGDPGAEPINSPVKV